MDNISLNFNYFQSISSEHLLYNENELRSFLGIRSNEQFTELKRKISLLANDVVKVACPKICWRFVEVKKGIDGQLFLGDMCVKSFDLSKNLLNCDFSIIFCATLGVGVDRLIQKNLAKSSTDGVTTNAISSAYIEGLCDLFNDQMKDRFGSLSSRFSCGYGDFKILHQKDILKLLETEKNIGVFCTDSSLLVPSKSVTAIIGIKKGKDDEDIRASE